MTAKIEVTILTAPAAWATALVNNDWSGLTGEEAIACRAWIVQQKPWSVVDVARDDDGNCADPRFTWSFSLYGGTASGGDVLDYVAHRVS